MRDLWLLPDYLQSGVVEALEDGAVHPLHEIIDLASLPPALVLGIPEELLERHRNDEFVYSQICMTKSHERYFTCSTRAGRDVSGRSVFVTNVQILGKSEFPRFPPVPPSAVPEATAPFVQKLIGTLSHQQSSDVIALSEMLQAQSRAGNALTFSSEKLYRSANPHDWMPKKKS